MSTTTLPPLSPDIRAALTAPVPSKSDAAKFLANAAEARRQRLATLPKWRRHFDELLEHVPEKDRREASETVVLLLSELAAAAVIDPIGLARAASAAQAEEIRFIEPSAPTG